MRKGFYTIERFIELNNGSSYPINDITNLHEPKIMECTECNYYFIRKPYEIFSQGRDKFCISCNKINSLTDDDGSVVLQKLQPLVKKYKQKGLIFIPEYKREDLVNEKGNKLKNDLSIFTIDNLNYPIAMIEIGRVIDSKSIGYKLNFCNEHTIVFEGLLATTQCDYYFEIFIQRLLEFNKLEPLDKKDKIDEWFPSFWINDIRDK
jgi:hypothetical protein